MNWIIAALLGLAAAGHGAQAAATLRTAAQTEAEPKFVAGERAGEPVVQGLCVDIFRAIERTDGGLAFSGDQHWIPSARLEASVRAGLLDVACGMVRTTQRAQDLLLLEPELFSLQYVLLARADDTANVANWEDIIRLGGDNVVLSVHGTGPSRQLDAVPALRVDAGSTSVRQNLHKLLLGRGRFFYYRLPASHPLIRDYCGQHLIKVLPAVMQQAPAYMMVGRHVPAATAQRIGDALRKLRDSGELDQLARKWQVGGKAATACL